MAVTAVTRRRFKAPFFRYRTMTYPTPHRALIITFMPNIPGNSQSM